MGKPRIIIICVSLSLLFAFSASAQRVELLDLTKKKVRTETSEIAPGRGGLIGGSSIRQKSELSLKLALENMDKQQYEMGERFVYEVSLENTGKQPLLLPWEPEEQKVQRGTSIGHSAGLLIMNLSLMIDEIGDDAIFGAERVYAATSMPDTLKKLLPGQKVRIRAPGVWYIGNQDISRRWMPTLPRKFTVRAKVGLGDYTTDIRSYEPVFSNNLLIELRKR